VVNEAEPGLIQDMTKLMASLAPQGAGSSTIETGGMLMLISRRCF